MVIKMVQDEAYNQALEDVINRSLCLGGKYAITNIELEKLKK